ncbi:MAG: 3-isopropylmalate dehydratase small subunit [Chloroflexi bacterium]|nr:MAG: 3-isopropylmalate dehydratase small subunit [Chloroflexota bacterium]TMG54944.1 MAG: 3-isopropylmalate dehydratase small subunit [Chloroflexota bacterium]
MEPVRVVTGRALPLGRANVDTDQIIPSHWLKRIERTGYGLGLFEAWRKDPSFVLNDGRYRGANILIAGANFGCGSSREHAVWALQEFGFRAVIAPTMADIFRSNSIKNGLVPVELNADAVSRLLAAVQADANTTITVDVAARTVAALGVKASFPLTDFVQTQLLEGLDEIALTLRHEPDIAAFEVKRPEWLPHVR